MDFHELFPGGIANAALASLQYHQYEKSNKIEDLDKAISAIDNAIKDTPISDERRARHITQHGVFILEKYDRTGNNQYSAKGLSLLNSAVQEMKRTGGSLETRESTLRAVAALLGNQWQKDKSILTLVQLREAEFELVRVLWMHGKEKSGSKMLQEATNSCMVAWQTTKDLKHIDAAIQGFRSMLRIVPQPVVGGFGRTYGIMQDSHSDSDSDRESEKATGQKRPSRQERLFRGILDLLEMKQDKTKTTSDIVAFKKAAEEYFETCKPSRLRELHVLADLMDMWKKAYQQQKTDQNLDGLVDVLRMIATRSDPADGFKQVNTFNDLSGYLSQKYKCTQNLDDLKESIKYAIKTYQAASSYNNGKAFEEMIMDGGAKGSFLWNIAEKYFQLFKCTKDEATLRKAITYLEDSVKSTKRDKELTLPRRYHNLGDWYRALYEATKVIQMLEKSVKAFEDAVEAVPEAQRAFVGDFDSIVESVVNGNNLLHELTGNPKFASKVAATQASREATEQVDSEIIKLHLDTTRSVFGAILEFQDSRKEIDLSNAISKVKKQLETQESSNSAIAIHKLSLAHLLMQRYEGFGNVEDLQEIIKLISYPIDNINWTIGVKDKEEVALALSFRSLAHSRLFEREHEEQDWGNAVRFGKAAVLLGESDEAHSERSTIYSHMGLIYKSKFEQDRQILWLDEATEWFRKAVDANEESQSDEANVYSLSRDMANLAASGYMKFQMNGKLNDLQTAIGWAEEAVEVDEAMPVWKAGVISNLGGMLHSRYMRLKDKSDLEEAIRLQRIAREATEGVLGDFSKMNNLASSLFTRFQNFGAMEDLEEATQLMQEANDKVPINHPDAHSLLQNLRTMESAQQAAKSKVPPAFRGLIEALTGMPFDESTVSPEIHALLEQGKKNGEFGPDGMGFNPFAGLALPDLGQLRLDDSGRGTRGESSRGNRRRDLPW